MSVKATLHHTLYILSCLKYWCFIPSVNIANYYEQRLSGPLPQAYLTFFWNCTVWFFWGIHHLPEKHKLLDHGWPLKTGGRRGEGLAIVTYCQLSIFMLLLQLHIFCYWGCTNGFRDCTVHTGSAAPFTKALYFTTKLALVKVRKEEQKYSINTPSPRRHGSDYTLRGSNAPLVIWASKN